MVVKQIREVREGENHSAPAPGPRCSHPSQGGTSPPSRPLASLSTRAQGPRLGASRRDFGCGPEPGAGAPPTPRKKSGEAHCDRAHNPMKTRRELAITYPLSRAALPPLLDRRIHRGGPDIEGPLYTMIAYHVGAGAHCVETLAAETGTAAAGRLRKKLGGERGDLEIVAVIWAGRTSRRWTRVKSRWPHTADRRNKSRAPRRPRGAAAPAHGRDGPTKDRENSCVLVFRRCRRRLTGSH